MAKVETETIRIILENGEEIEVTYPLEIAEGLFEEMHEAQSRDGFWYVGNYRDARAMYKGAAIDNINMKRVIGTAQGLPTKRASDSLKAGGKSAKRKVVKAKVIRPAKSG